MSEEYILKAINISKNIEKLDFVSTHTPYSVAAASILLMANTNNLDCINKKKISMLFEISEVTLNKTYKKLEEYKSIILNNDTTNNNTKIDIAIMQKLLPKLHGSRKKLVGPLETLAGFCLVRNESQSDDQNKTKTLYQQFISEKRDSAKWEITYSISFEKIERMLKNVIENGFTSYAEA
jgi:hypothetical protein